MGSARVGSNPTGVESRNGGLAQLVERVVSNDEAPGSKPGFSNNKIWDVNHLYKKDKWFRFTLVASQEPTLVTGM